MTETPAPPGTTTTAPPPSANGSTPSAPQPPSVPQPPQRAHTRISGIRAGLIAGALVMAAAGTARITRLRQIMRRDRRNSQAG